MLGLNRINGLANRMWFSPRGREEPVEMNENVEFRDRRSQNDRRQAQLSYSGDDSRKGDRRSGQERRKAVRRTDDPLLTQARD